MYPLAFFAHANVFHHDGQPVPIEMSIASIPEDGTDPKPEKPPARIRASGIPGFLRPGQEFCHLAQGNRGLIVVKGSNQRKNFEKLGLFTINLEILPHFSDLNDRSLPDHLHDEVHEDFNISECTMVKSYRFARYLQHFNKLQGECKRQTAHLVQTTSILTAAVAEWYRYRTVACFVTGSSPVPLKTRRVGQRCTLNLSRAETSSRWCGVVVRRGGASSGVVHVT
ncbi:uncharacterized protein TNCV_2472121 [Trichonephila clavipes]|nr:uncharacterized protein TNCV_2472121 [Trichonephila clavipes]